MFFILINVSKKVYKYKISFIFEVFMFYENLVIQLPEDFFRGFVGGAMIAMIIALGIIAIIFLAAVYVYFSYTWMIIAKKLKYKKSWIAWIPIANLAMMLQLGGFDWKWIFLILIPLFGWVALAVLVVIATWRIFEKIKYPGWFSLSIIIPKVGWIFYLVAIGFVAFQKKNGKR
jgi:hypothetical protein